nr:arginine--tRNA ligase [uncultured Sellimonas sp.]
MKKLVDFLTNEVKDAFERAGYDSSLAKVTLSNRPDLCEYQCNGAMAAAKTYHKAPIMIAADVVAFLKESSVLKEAEAVNPGFINMKVSETFLAEYAREMAVAERLGVEDASEKKTVVIDFGGANVAKPLHVGHLRSAVIGESLKRIIRFKGHEVIGDVHLGDWGYQMGLVITELKKRQPDLPYFDDAFEGEYPKEAPFTITDLEEIYPYASGYAKEHAEYKEEALNATFELQNGKRGYRALWKHIMNVSVADLKKNYGNLNVTFDLWKGEADAQPYIPGMVEMMKEKGFAHIDQGALVVDVKEETDTKEIPPCMILKSDGAALYDTTDLATLVEREELYKPDEVIYVVDKRQELHFVQVFRCAKKTGIVPEDTKLTFIGFGTMNGKDGKPFKTREGGVMRLADLIQGINDEMYQKITENRTVSPEESKETAKLVGLAALKYGDLSNQASKDYIFDLDKFASFEGNTGPYILYTIVRIKSILNKYKENGGNPKNCTVQTPASDSEKALMLEAAKFNAVMDTVYEELAPHKICAYVYDLANIFNRFYHDTRILGEEDENRKAGYIALLDLVKDILETSIGLLGFDAPERM